MGSDPAPLHSAIYEGRVRHRRFHPRAHAFAYRVCLLYLDLAELDRVFAGRWLWSVDRANVAAFHRADYLGPPGIALDTAVRERVAAAGRPRPAGPIRLLTHPRYCGYVFNPVSFYYCFDPADTCVETIVAEVTNTPWKERHAYVLPVARPGTRHHRFRLDKQMHVSPFLDMDYAYDWRFSEPGERLAVHMRNERAGRCEFDATLSLARRPLDGRGLARALAAHPLMTARVTAAIHWQALRLWLKGVPFLPHPRKRGRSAAR
ncbi:MAG: DUF1365 domain-containing protein [Halofilum sp. (in: g-proteobacteria)]|nr:DUF1365 domain-containing protein [Halofilum sp. (in: g-proteobacteria)]